VNECHVVLGVDVVIRLVMWQLLADKHPGMHSIAACLTLGHWAIHTEDFLATECVVSRLLLPGADWRWPCNCWPGRLGVVV